MEYVRLSGSHVRSSKSPQFGRLTFSVRGAHCEREAACGRNPHAIHASVGKLMRAGGLASCSSDIGIGARAFFGWATFSKLTAQNFNSGCLATRPIALIVK